MIRILICLSLLIGHMLSLHKSHKNKAILSFLYCCCNQLGDLLDLEPQTNVVISPDTNVYMIGFIILGNGMMRKETIASREDGISGFTN